MDGLINVLKEPGLTSHDVVQQLRRLFGLRRIGHAGTLDPAAAGVLPICIGQGTRVAEFMMNKPKSYRAELTFGLETDTCDVGGRVIRREAGVRLEVNRLQEVLGHYRGELQQLPPMFSAVHHQGKRLYQLARSGQVVKRKPRRVTIYSLELIAVNEGHPYPRAMIDVTCSKGTYIRSLCADLGRELGCGAYLSFLVRTASGPFKLEHSFTVSEIGQLWQNGDTSFLLPLDVVLQDIPAFTVKAMAVPGILNGLPVTPSGITGGVGNHNPPRLARLYTPEGRILALASYQSLPNGSWVYKPRKVFRELSG